MVTVKKPTKKEVKNLSKKQFPSLFEMLKDKNLLKERLEEFKKKTNKQ